MHTPAFLGFALTRLVGLLLRDVVVLTRDDVDGLMGVADFRRSAGGNYPHGRLAYRQCRCFGVAVRVRTAAELTAGAHDCQIGIDVRRNA